MGNMVVIMADGTKYEVNIKPADIVNASLMYQFQDYKMNNAMSGCYIWLGLVQKEMALQKITILGLV